MKSGWPVVAGSFLGLMAGNGPVLQFTYGVFLQAIGRDLGWGRSTLSLALSVGLACTGLAVPVAGRLIDRFGIHRVTVPACCLIGLGLAATGLMVTSPAQLIFAYAVLGVLAAAQTPLPYAKAVAAWFDRRRGLALGGAMAGVGVGTSLMPALAQGITQREGWRAAYLGLAAVMLLVAVPALLFLVRMPRRDQGEGPRDPEGLTAGEAVRSPSFWLLAAAFFIVAAACNGTAAHLLPLLASAERTSGTAISVFTLIGAAMIVGRLAAGFLADRLFAPHVCIGFFLLPLTGCALLAALEADGGYLAAPLVGLGVGAEVDLAVYLIGRYLGPRHLGEIYGWQFMIFMLGNAAGPLAMGTSFDLAGSYRPCLVGFSILLAGACCAMAALKSYRFPPGQSACFSH